MILGTAGHIDHGKTTLVKALTGVDTDRLPEEQRRGITIELGFAPLVLPEVGTIGVVDVPGHEAFVRTMLAGASGIDLALLVVAADEGVMPQTREHLAILGLLGIPRGVIALTKADLVDPDWLALVEEDVADAVRGSPLHGAPRVAVSTVTGAGLDQLRQAIIDVARQIPDRQVDDVFRMPVDRAFSVRGTGTVVTGTVWSGQLRRDDTVRILPGSLTARVRGLQSHGSTVDVGTPGSRLAVNLGGVEVAAAGRGSSLVVADDWMPTIVLRADIDILDDAPRIGPRSRVRFHLGTREVGARVIARYSLAPGAVKVPARVVLEEPVVARGGDRFVLRAGSPVTTVGGGTIVDATPGHRRARPWAESGLLPGERVRTMVREAGARGVALRSLPVRAGLKNSQLAPLLATLADEIVIISDSAYERSTIAQLEAHVVSLVNEHHERAPLDEGVSLQALRSAIGGSGALADDILRRLTNDGTLRIDAGVARRADWTVRPTAAQQSALDALARHIRASGREPPTTSELASSGVVTDDGDVLTLLRVLDRRGLVRQVEPDRFYATEVLATMTEVLRRGMAPGRAYTPAELRDVLGVSRKYLIPLLEYYDRIGVTERHAQGRIVRSETKGTFNAS